MNFRHLSALLLFAAALAAASTGTLTSLHDSDPSQWTGQEVYQILHNSPWTRIVKMDFPSGGTLTNQSDGTQNAPPPPAAGGMGGRRGMGGGRQATYSSGNRGSTSSNSKTGPTEVLIQWQSALVIRVAAEKKAGDKVDPATLKPLDDYVIGLVGLPITAVGGRAASTDTDNTLSAAEEQRIEDNVKTSASIIRSGHDALTPTKVELDQGSDGRMLIHFAKSDPITAAEKTVEFQLKMGKTELRKKFPLKEMEYQRKLEL